MPRHDTTCMGCSQQHMTAGKPAITAVWHGTKSTCSQAARRLMRLQHFHYNVSKNQHFSRSHSTSHRDMRQFLPQNSDQLGLVVHHTDLCFCARNDRIVLGRSTASPTSHLWLPTPNGEKLNKHNQAPLTTIDLMSVC